MNNDLNQVRVIDCLVGLLSIDSDIRTTAEHYLTQMEQQSNFGSRLLNEVILQPSYSVQLRQLACIVLKNYIKTHWSPQSTHFVPPEVTPTEKAQIKSSISTILSNPEPKLRTASAMVITGIMHWEWPTEWPTAFQELVQCLRSPDPRLLRGAVACLDMFVSSETLGEGTAPAVAELLLPELLRIFMSAEAAKGTWVRDKVVSIFMSCVQLLSFSAGFNDKRVGAIFGTNLPSWVAAFAALLSKKEASLSVGHVGICTSVVRSLNIIMVSYPQYIAPYVPQLLSRIWTCFAQMYTHYQSIEVYGEKKSLLEQTSNSKIQENKNIPEKDNNHHEDSTIVDDIDERELLSDAPTLPSLVAALLDFLTLVTERPRLRGTIQPLLASLAQLTVGYLQVTSEQSEAWDASPELLAASDEDDGLAVNVRLAGKALLTLLSRSFGSAGLRACWEAVDASLNQAAGMRRDGNPHWWRLREAALTALCAIAPTLVSTRRCPADIPTLASILLTQDVANAFPSSIGSTIAIDLGTALLAGRALCAAAELSWRLPEAGSLPFVRAIASALGEPRSAALCICAARAALVFYNTLPPVALAPHMSPILRGLARLVAGTVEDALSLFLYVLGPSIKVAPEAAADPQTLSEITAALLEAMGRNPNDTILADDVAQTFYQLLSIPNCFGGVAQHLLPALSQILLAGESLQGLALVALGMLRASLAAFTASLSSSSNNTVGNSVNSSSQQGNAISHQNVPVQVKQAFSALGRFIANFACDAIDADFMRSAIDVMRLFFLTFGEGLLNWTDDVIAFIFSVFAPVFASDTTAAAIVPDCRTMIAAPALCDFLHYSARAPRPLGSALLPLLTDVMRRTLRTDDPFAAASFITIFAHVAVLDAAGLVAFFAKNSGGSDGGDKQNTFYEKKSFAALMEKWLASAQILRASGLYQVKVSTVALENILLLRNPFVEKETVTISDTSSPASSSSNSITLLPVAILQYLCEIYKEVDWESEMDGSAKIIGDDNDDDDDVIDDVMENISVNQKNNFTNKKSFVSQQQQLSSSSTSLSSSVTTTTTSSSSLINNVNGSVSSVSSFDGTHGLDGIADEIKSQYTIEALTDFDEDALEDEDEFGGNGAPEEIDLPFIAQRQIYKMDLKQQIEGFVGTAAKKGLTGFFKSLYDLLPPKDKAVFEVIWNRSKKAMNLM